MVKYLISDLDSILENKDFVKSLRDNLTKGKLLFIPSNPEDKELTKMYGGKIVNSFKQKGIQFIDVEYINRPDDIKVIKNNINDYSMVFLMGGVTLIQNEFISKIDLKSILKEFTGVIMGMSAGALNMCDVTLDSAYFGDSSKTVLTKGLGLVNIVVEVHFDINNYEQINEVKKTGLKVYCIPNDSAVMFKDNAGSMYGNIYLYDETGINKIEQE